MDKYLVLCNSGFKGIVKVDFLEREELNRLLHLGLYEGYDFLNSKNWECINGSGTGKRVLIIKNGEITPSVKTKYKF